MSVFRRLSFVISSDESSLMTLEKKDSKWWHHQENLTFLYREYSIRGHMCISFSHSIDIILDCVHESRYKIRSDIISTRIAVFLSSLDLILSMFIYICIYLKHCAFFISKFSSAYSIYWTDRDISLFVNVVLERYCARLLL